MFGKQAKQWEVKLIVTWIQVHMNIFKVNMFEFCTAWHIGVLRLCLHSNALKGLRVEFGRFTFVEVHLTSFLALNVSYITHQNLLMYLSISLML